MVVFNSGGELLVLFLKLCVKIISNNGKNSETWKFSIDFYHFLLFLFLISVQIHQT